MLYDYQHLMAVKVSSSYSIEIGLSSYRQRNKNKSKTLRSKKVFVCQILTL